MVIASGREPGVLQRLLRGEEIGTYFRPRDDRLAARKRWIAFAVPPQGCLMVDAGAKKALTVSWEKEGLVSDNGVSGVFI